MIPIVTPAEMNEIDTAAPETVEELIQRAGVATAWRARQLLGGTYGKRVVAIVGKGNNGADGRVAGETLSRWGVKVQFINPTEASTSLPSCDLVLDAAYGTGIKREYVSPRSPSPVLAVDIPSGICGLTGRALGEPLKANETITFQAMKPGHLLAPGVHHSGVVTVADIGLDVTETRLHLVEATDIRSWLPPLNPEKHKWNSACWVIGGSSGMRGAPQLAAKAAQRSGCGYVRLSIPGESQSESSELVGFPIPETGWNKAVTAQSLNRFHSVVIGPGLGRSDSTVEALLKTVSTLSVPTVVDADAITILGQNPDLLRESKNEMILTPHEREFECLTGHRPDKDRIEDVRESAKRFNVVILLKGPTTVIGHPDGRCLIVNNGDQRLATAGTGDVLSGIIGGVLSQGVSPFKAAAIGAWIHGAASKRCVKLGMIASDIIPEIPEVLNEAYLG